jgi:hypothetical protein
LYVEYWIFDFGWISNVPQNIFPGFRGKPRVGSSVSHQFGKEGRKDINGEDGTFFATLLLPWRALHVYLSPPQHKVFSLCRHLFHRGLSSRSALPSSCLLSLLCFIISVCAIMPQSPAIVTATAAIARERAGRIGSGRHPRHPRPALPDDAPDVSVESTHGLTLLFPFICPFSVFLCLVFHPWTIS